MITFLSVFANISHANLQKGSCVSVVPKNCLCKSPKHQFGRFVKAPCGPLM